MPRIYAPNAVHDCDWSGLTFVAGVGVLAAGEDTTFFSDAGYTIDTSKHMLEVWDGLTIAQLDALITYFGGTPSALDSKYTKVRALETLISAKMIAALTVASAAATAGSGKTKITITDPGTATYYLKTAATTSPDILYGDVPDATWQRLPWSPALLTRWSPMMGPMINSPLCASPQTVLWTRLPRAI